MLRLRLSTIALVTLLVLVVGGSAMAGAPGGWFGPNYQAPPVGANTGNVNDGVTNLTWFNWWDANRQLWYYAYQVGNWNMQPHVASLLMALNQAQVNATVYEGHSYALRPMSLLNWWNPTQIVSGNTIWFGWASDPGHEALPNTGTSVNPYFEITSIYSPGPTTMKLTDLDYSELHYEEFPDPFSIFTDIPAPTVPEPGSLLALGWGVIGLAGVMIRRRS